VGADRTSKLAVLPTIIRKLASCKMLGIGVAKVGSPESVTIVEPKDRKIGRKGMKGTSKQML